MAFTNYKKQLNKEADYEHMLELRYKTIEKEKQELAEHRIKLYGKPDTPFYGLKKPSKFKCLNYISEEYNICPDLVGKIQDILIKKDNDKNMDKLKEQYMNPEYDYNQDDSRKPLKLELKESWYGNTKDYWARKEYKKPFQHWKYNRTQVPRNWCPGFTNEIRIGGILFHFMGRTYHYPRGLLNYEPTLALSRKSERGGTFDKDDTRVIGKEELIKACEHYTCVPYKSSWNKKQLWNHLMKYA